ncbi:interleukin-3 receptor subunit alpha [Sorex araneus]|uniref:interleukin-3 receptor subunit alpha n=1 Tax=Sorex araneus TaxID=42254 RepID=UPI0024339E69|nr:interleukin-3 receptor subunit alpha [Sorex araneus]
MLVSSSSTPPAAGSALPVTFLWLPTLLGATPSPPPAADQGPAEPGSPIWNLRVDPAQRRLTWDLWDNITDVVCIRGSGNVRTATARSHCQYPFLPRCHPTNFTVRTTRGPRFSASILYPLSVPATLGGPAVGGRVGGREGGREAGGLRERLSIQCSPRTRQVRACQHYGRDPRGVHVSCDFRGLFGASGNLQRFWVTGSSGQGPIPCAEILHRLPEIERLAPRNVSSTCNGSRAELRWAASSRLQSGFQYQVQTQQGGNAPQTLTTWENQLSLPHAGDFVVRIRVQGLDYGHWGPWGSPLRFSCQVEDPTTPGGVWAPALLAVLGALLAATATLVLWSRSSLPEKLFPPIPRLRDPLREHLPSGQLVFQDKQECPVPATVEIVQEL